MKEMNARGSFTAIGVDLPPSRDTSAGLSSSGPPPLLRLFERPADDAAAVDCLAGSTTSFVATAMALVTRFFACVVSRTASRLRGPRTGWRGLKIHPTPGTGVPPRRRPRSNNQGCSPWNSWNESFDSTVPSTFSATRSKNASPRPMAPAGGWTYSPRNAACSKRGSSEGSILCANVASTMTVISAFGWSRRSSTTASSSCFRLGRDRPSVAMLDPSTTMCSMGMSV